MDFVVCQKEEPGKPIVELYFPPPLTTNIANRVLIMSKAAQPTAFKIKTTRPDHYTVKPRMGFLPARGQQVVQITYRVRGGAPEEPQDKALRNDRFQIELRALQSGSEMEAFRHCEAENYAAARKALGMGAAAGSDAVGEITTELWSRKDVPPGSRKVLKCHFTRPEGVETNLIRGRSGLGSAADSSPLTAGSGLETARPATQRSSRGAAASGAAPANPALSAAHDEQRREYTRVAEQLALQQELRIKVGLDPKTGKSAKAGRDIPAWLFVLLWLLCFYCGLVLDRHLPDEYSSGRWRGDVA